MTVERRAWRDGAGLTRKFEPGDQEALERALAELRALPVAQLRVELDWQETAQDWPRSLLERMAGELEPIPVLDAPATDDQFPLFAAAVRRLIDCAGAHFSWLEVRQDAAALEPDEDLLARAVAAASGKGKRIALGGIDARRSRFLGALAARAIFAQVDAVSLAGGDPEDVARVRSATSGRLEVWLCGPKPSPDETGDVTAFLAALGSGAERVFWGGAHSLILRLWQEMGAARLAHDWPRLTARSRSVPHAVVFGGAGFVGCNLAHRLLREGRRVLVFDSLARRGVERNLRWLKDEHGDRLQVEIADVRDSRAVRSAVRGAAQVFQFAAQVAVTSSLADPIRDFEVNARGTLNVLEAARAQPDPPSIVFTSTNKVYGGLLDVVLERSGRRYQPADAELRRHGIGERRPLEFESPYGCSKGAADQYVLDYARTFGIPAVVFRMSCIYGPRQFGNEDQGWVAHFVLRALQRRPLTLYGDGFQVRDVLFVEDLVEAFLLAQANVHRLWGEAFNIGGGPERTVSLLELLERIEALCGGLPPMHFEDWRPGDQRYYVSDTRKFQAATGWRPRVDVEEGVLRLREWLLELTAGRAEQLATAG
jgi:CDP-paratose 2-epimerase